MIPRATYRIQFHKEFPFAAAEAIAPYLRDLGISHLYASPIATARAGSTHGYDVVDPAHINPELGGEDGFRALAATLKAHGIGIILDIVPNHMAVGGADNRWWLDVLAHGEASEFARYFDIDWRPSDPDLHGKLLAPFLGQPLHEALAQGQIRLVRDGDGVAVLAHDTHRFPLRPEDQQALAALDASQCATRFDTASATGRQQLVELLERQQYRLAWWRTAPDRINWRRFFDITELAGLRVEDEAVFQAVHALPLRLYAQGLIDGVRVDHVDGLADPPRYCRRLREALTAAEPQRPADASNGPAWLIVEKILGDGEAMPASWQTDGTSGYDFMDHVSALQHDPAGEEPLSAHWRRLSGRPADFAAEELQARGEILAITFPGQLDAVAAAFLRLARSVPETGEITLGMLRRGIAALLRQLHVYRSYGNSDVTANPHLLAARDTARATAAPGEAGILDLLYGWISGERAGDPQLREDAVRRFEQLSAPVSAKAVEDTAFYRYARLLSRTDVGFSPANFSLSVDAFAARVQARAADHPNAMLTTATHDHKRGEDVRARLAVLSEIPERWIAFSQRWLERTVDSAVSAGDRYAILQTLVGAWPPQLRPDDRYGLDAFAARVAGWSQKAIREAKLRSSWVEPDTAYEAASTDLVTQMLSGGSENAREIAAFVDEIEPAGSLNGIVQAILRTSLPGVPDLYQGCESWDFSLVDPDNRRPVDFAALTQSRDGKAALRNPKQAVITHILSLRAQHADLFAQGDFTHLTAVGLRKNHVFAFTRELAGERLFVAVPLHCAGALARADGVTMDLDWWGDTSVALPDGTVHPAAQLFADAPWAITLTRRP